MSNSKCCTVVSMIMSHGIFKPFRNFIIGFTEKFPFQSSMVCWRLMGENLAQTILSFGIHNRNGPFSIDNVNNYIAFTQHLSVSIFTHIYSAFFYHSSVTHITSSRCYGPVQYFWCVEFQFTQNIHAQLSDRLLSKCFEKEIVPYLMCVFRCFGVQCATVCFMPVMP